MSKLYVLAGGIVEPGGGRLGKVGAFVAYNPRAGVSRLFKVSGSPARPEVTELPSATTVDLSAFRRELEQELEPEVRAIGGTACIAQPKSDFVTGIVKRHLAEVDGLEIP